MAKVTVIKEKNYTTIDNGIFKDTRISFKAKGLLTTMLSLPPTWNYTIEGLATLSKDGRDSIKTALKELEKFGYLERKQVRNDNGSFCDLEYFVYEKPQPKEPLAENPPTDKSSAENHRQLSTYISNTDKSNTDEVNTYGLNTDNSFSLEKDNSQETCELHNSHFPEEQKNESRISMSLGVKQKQSKEKPLKDMPIRAKEIADSLVDDKELSWGVQVCVEYFLGKYKQKNRKEHLPLRNETLQSVVEVMLSSLTVPHDEDLENMYQSVFYPLVSEASDWEDRKEVIDKYFDTEFREKCDYSLVHFTQRDIITHVMQKCRIGEDTYWFYSESVD